MNFLAYVTESRIFIFTEALLNKHAAQMQKVAVRKEQEGHQQHATSPPPTEKAIKLYNRNLGYEWGKRGSSGWGGSE
jgi:hypothetical protein